MAPKRPRQSLSISEKQAVIAHAEGFTGKKVELAKSLGLPLSTLSAILKQKDLIEESVGKLGCQASKRRTIKVSPYENIESELFEWLQNDPLARLAPVDGKVLKAKALEIAARLGAEDFSASNGWTDRFKKRHGLFRRGAGYSRTDPPPKRAGKDSHQFRVFQTVLCYDVMPGPGMDVAFPARATVVLCCTSDESSRFTPLVVGTQALENPGSLPTIYEHHPGAFLEEKVLERYVRFLCNLDNWESACPRRKTEVCLDFDLPDLKDDVPPNVQLRVSPRNSFKVRGIVRAFKFKYRSLLVKEAVKDLASADLSLVKNYRKDFRDVLRLINQAWVDVSAATIQSCMPGLESSSDIVAQFFPDTNFADEELEAIFESLGVSPGDLPAYVDFDKDLEVTYAPAGRTSSPFVQLAAGSIAGDSPPTGMDADCEDIVSCIVKVEEDSSEAPASVGLQRCASAGSSHEDSSVALPSVTERGGPSTSSGMSSGKSSEVLDYLFYEALKGLQAVQIYVACHKAPDLLGSIKNLEASLHELHKADLA